MLWSLRNIHFAEIMVNEEEFDMMFSFLKLRKNFRYRCFWYKLRNIYTTFTFNKVQFPCYGFICILNDVPFFMVFLFLLNRFRYFFTCLVNDSFRLIKTGIFLIFFLADIPFLSPFWFSVYQILLYCEERICRSSLLL